MGDLLLVVAILVLLLLCFIYWVVSKAIKALYGLLPWVRKRRREAQRRQQEELFKKQQERERQERERQRREEARRKAIGDGKKRFEEVVMAGRFPSKPVLAILADCDHEIPVNVKEGLEELLYGRCSFRPMTYRQAVFLIEQRQRVEERAKARVARGDEPTGPVTPAEAYQLLGVSEGCSPDDLTAAYHRVVGQWHPDRLNEAMAQELREYATRRTARINEAFQLLRQRV